MSRMIFVNLPVQDLDASVDFFTKLGFTFNQQFTDENATCMVVSEQACVMLLVRPFFGSFTTKDVADASSTTEVVLAVSADSREEVDTLVDQALALGGSPTKDPQDEGYMYGRSFYDLDGHAWEVMWMDPAAVQ
jgi:predicted lactoylglutathione lyase